MGMWLISGILATVILFSLAEDGSVPDKSYIEYGHLPKFSNIPNKESKEILPTENAMYSLNSNVWIDYPSDLQGKRNVGAFLNSRGKPRFATSVRNGPENPSDEDTSSIEIKRNVATLARLGRLNAIRYGRFQSRLVGSKRLNSEEKNPDANNEENDIDVLGEINCFRDDVPTEVNPNLTKKRYVAALARSGRLPIWHSQRMWDAGKRDDSLPYWSSSRYVNDNNELDNALDESPLETQKMKRCKKLFGGDKRNVAALAKNGKLPYYGGKRNIAALARNGKLPSYNEPTGKRNLAALAKNGRLPFNSYGNEKRNIQAMARNGKMLFIADQDGKRNIAASAQNRKLPFNRNQEDKRNIQAMARNGKMLFNSDQSGKRNIQALARNGKIFQDGKRNVAALARNGKLPSFSMSQDSKRNVAALESNGMLPSFSTQEEGKRNVAALARNGKLPSFSRSEEDKRNVAALARNGKLPFTNQPGEKRNIQAMARNGNLPFISNQNEKRNIQAMARSGKLLFNSFPSYKRSEEDSESFENTQGNFESEKKRNQAALARNGKLRFRNQEEKKNVAALARNGKLPFNSYKSNKREGEDDFYVDENESLINEEGKRNKFPAYNENGKRNVAALARNGKLPGSV